MEGIKSRRTLKLDGRVGEGGGQIVRIAVALAALTGIPLQIDNIRGNRPGKRGGGLKAQHAASIQYLAEATGASTTGCSVGSNTMIFQAKLSPSRLADKNIKIAVESVGSIFLIFQTILPFLIFAGDSQNSPITVTIRGGTNVSFSLSYEYLDQVLLPALERFGIKVERRLGQRGWSHGTPQMGHVEFQITPLSPGTALSSPSWPTQRGALSKIDVSIIVPKELQIELKRRLTLELDLNFPHVEANFVLIEDSGHKARMYALLVAHTTTDLRFGRDWLYDKKAKDKTPEELGIEIARKVIDDLDAELRKGGLVDEYLQDQLIIFQVLAEGKSSIPGSAEAVISQSEIFDRTDGPIGDGSLHTTTARWVTSQILPQVRWADNGRVCEGIGIRFK